MDLDIFHRHQAEVTPVSTTPATPTETTAEKVGDGIKKFFSVLDLIGEKFEEGLAFAVKYELPEEAIVSAIFGPAAGLEAVAAINLIQRVVMLVKQKSAALPTNLTSDQMLAEEMSVLGPAIVQLLAKHDVTDEQAQKLIEAVVAIFNTHPAAA